MRVCVVGVGYVGLVAGASLSELGNYVVCCDRDADRIRRLQLGEIPIYEPGLETLVPRNVKESRLSFTTDLAAATGAAEVIFVAVGTPTSADGEADLSQVFATAETIAPLLKDGAVVVIKSTVPVGTGDEVQRIIASKTKVRFAVASNPEFLKEGDAINDFMKPTRIVIGTVDEHARSTMRRLYEPFVHASDRILMTDRRSAELIKYASNAMLAARLSFINELAGLAEQLGADIDVVRRGVGADPRIGAKYLFPGPGFGGSCFPKDLRALQASARAVGVRLDMVDSVLRINERQKRVVCRKIVARFGEQLNGHRITVWGLSFKPQTDDIRESPALALIDELLERGATVAVRDPAAMEAVRAVLGDRVVYSPQDYESVRGADALVLMTEWREFRTPDFQQIRTLMAKPILFDGRNIWDGDHVRSLGFEYSGIGRPRPS